VCSRICCGLVLQGIQFAVLPPHFAEGILGGLDWAEFVPNYAMFEDCFKTCIPYLVAAVSWQIKKGWI